MYGNGSDGPLSITSGTTNIAQDVKHQFTTVNVASGATLTGYGDGAVLYICATESINIDGNLYAGSNTPGDRSVSVTIDGQTFTSPGVASGGAGGDDGGTSGVGGLQSMGFGGGGAGGSSGVVGGSAGDGGNGGGSPVGGASVYDEVDNYYVSHGVSGNSGASGGGGSGGVYVDANSTNPSSWIRSGAGGTGHGSNGGSATFGGSNVLSMSGGGGGGAGGLAGRSGIHIVLRAPTININSSATLITRIYANKDGGKGGNGGARVVAGGSTRNPRAGSGGGGGGGANAGNLYLTGEALNYTSATYRMSAGVGGSGGSGNRAGASGANGTDGRIIAHRITIPRTHHLVKYYDGTNWVIGRAKGSIQSEWKESIIQATLIE